MSKSDPNSCQADLLKRFDDRVKKLEKSLPELRSGGINCCELTFTNIIDLLGIDNYFFHNCAMPLAGGFGGYKAENGWMGACGAVNGACMAIGIIMGGQERMDDQTMAMAYLKASKYCSEFEKQFGSVVCSKLCGHDFSTPEGMIDYQKNHVWKSTCYKFVVWAVDKVKKLTRRDLRNKWE